MSEVVLNIAMVVGSVVIGLLVSLVVLSGKKFIDIEKNRKTAEALKKQGWEESEKIKEITRASVEKRRAATEHEVKTKRARLEKIEEAIKNRDATQGKKEENLNGLKLKIASMQEENQGMEEKIKRTDKEILEKLSAKTGKKPEQLKEETMEDYSKRLANENKEKLAKIEEAIKEDAEKNAKKTVISVLQRLCSPTSVETRTVQVKVPTDAVKGKVVGKDGKNIRVFEEMLDVDVVFNDLPNTISLSAFQLVQRRIAQKAMEKLVRNRGVIDETAVKKTVKEAEKETDDELYEIGLGALKKMDIKHDDKEFCRITGRLQYRTSYGQNIMKHSMEVGWVAAMLGSELGLNTTTCRVSGFLHDLGKAIDQDPNVKDAHDYISKELMERFGFSWEEVHAAWTHHDAIPQETAEAMIVKAADAISASRPGARQESFDKYIERIRALEETAASYEGVKRAYAISAGRELRVMVDPESVQDASLATMAKNIAQQVEDEIVYPGQIKVNVIRRTKHTEIAK